MVRSDNRLTKSICKEWNWPPGVRCADTSFGASRQVQSTATSANVRGDENGRPGPPNQQSPQPALSLRPCRHYLPHPHLFVLLGLDGDPIVGAAVSLRPNSRRSSTCKLLDDAILLHQFAAAAPTRSHHRIRTGSLSAGVAEHIGTASIAEHTGQPESSSSKPQWPESPELPVKLCSINHTPPA